MSSTPADAGTEQTTTVIVGAGLPGLAVAAELRRRGVATIVVDGLDPHSAARHPVSGSQQRCDAPDSGNLRERNEILRHLRNYASSHHVDIRSIRAVQLARAAAAPGAGTAGWEVHTSAGILLTPHVVLTRCAQSQLRRMVSELDISAGPNPAAAMRALGIHLVGVGELITPSPKEVLRQAKTVGQAISALVNPGSDAYPATASLAMLPC
ncbi:FAD-dependent monooxygenase [Pseudarthrobacter sp. NPDC092439]|uniref:FAD-dependent monooxygenase n=1 Tax=unclassified Pseudarthrobacter TaxID=2647000 RepID=UPI003822722B